MVRLLFFLFVLFLGITFFVVAEEIVIDFTDPMFVQLDEEGKRLLSEYAKAYPKIKDFYKDIRIDANVENTAYLPEEGLQSMRLALGSAGFGEDEIKVQIERAGQTKRQYELRYRQSEGYARVDTKTDIPVPSSSRALVGSDFVREFDVTLSTPTMGYELSKNDPSKQFFSLNTKHNLGKAGAGDFGLPMMYFDTAPFSSNGTPLDGMVFRCPPSNKGKPYILEYVRQQEIDGAWIVEMRMSRNDLPNTFRKVQLDRNSWVIKSVEMSYRTGVGSENIHWSREMCTYDGTVDGIHLLKTYQRSFGGYDANAQGEKIVQQMHVDVTNIVPGSVDISEFDVAQFLPPDTKIGEITPVRLSTARIAAIIIGVILVILGIYLRMKRV